jgi:hypothetical protein
VIFADAWGDHMFGRFFKLILWLVLTGKGLSGLHGLGGIDCDCTVGSIWLVSIFLSIFYPIYIKSVTYVLSEEIITMSKKIFIKIYCLKRA